MKKKLGDVLKQYRNTTWIENDKEYGQVTISQTGNVSYRGSKKGFEIGRKRQFVIDLKKHPNTLIFIRQGVYKGGIGFAPKEVDGCIATENMPMFDVIDIEPDYLTYFLHSPIFASEINKLVPMGSAQKALHERQILKIEIEVPSVEEQLKVVSKIRSFRHKYDELWLLHEDQEQINNKLKTSILQDAIQGKLVSQDPNEEPAEKLLEKIKVEKEKLIKNGKLKKDKPLPPISKDEIPFELPKGWIWCKLFETCIKITDGFHNTPPISKNGFPYVMATHIKQEKIDFDNCYFVDELYHRELFNKARPENGDILYVNIGAGSGTPAIIEFEGEFSFKNSAILKIPKVISNKYIYYFLVYMRPKIFQEVTQGGAQPFLSLKKISELVIPLPPLNEQRRIVEKIESLIKICEEQEKNIAETKNNIEKLNQAVLREVFN